MLLTNFAEWTGDDFNRKQQTNHDEEKDATFAEESVDFQ